MVPLDRPGRLWMPVLAWLVLSLPAPLAGQSVSAPSQEGPLPDPTGWGTHVLAVAEAPDGAVWVGTYGQGIYVSRDGSGDDWERIAANDSTSISWDFVNAFAFAGRTVWYGTVGNGWGRSTDGGKTWRNWTLSDLGPQWQYVAPHGISVAGDTVYVATADGLRATHDGGETWREFGADVLPNKYLLALTIDPSICGAAKCSAPRITVYHLRGVSWTGNGGDAWVNARTQAADSPAGGPDPRAEARRADSLRQAAGASPLVREILSWEGRFREYSAPDAPLAEPGDRAHFWFRRPIAAEDDPYLDQTYLYGSTMGGNFQQHQGVEFNNPEGTDVHAIGDGVVAWAGPAEAGSNTVAVLHDRRLDGQFVWSTYYHNVDLVTKVGDRVAEGDVIAHVGHTGRATNDHLHLEIHVTPTDDVSQVIDPDQRYPKFTRNPQLWIEPLSGTGAIAGRVVDGAGAPVPGVRVYGVTKLEPRETPFSFAETYEDKAHPDPVFGENFAIGDVPPGEYVIGAEIGGTRVFRRVRVESGRVTEVELAP